MLDTPYHPTWVRSLLCALAVVTTACGQAQAEGPHEAPAPAEAPAAPVAPPEAPVEAAPAPVPAKVFRVATKDVEVRAAPEPGSALRGNIHAGHPFEVLGTVDGDGCAEGWLKLPAHGFLCAADTEATDAPAKAQPELVTYDPPDPDEFLHYIETGEYDHGQPIDIVPSVYAKRWKRFKGKLYADLDAWNAGKDPVSRLEGGAGNKYHFTEIVETERGPVLVRDDGQVAALDDVYLYPVSRLEGQDLEANPVPDGMMPAFAIGYDGTAVWPTPEAPPIPEDPEDAVEPPLRLPYHSTLLVEAEPVTPDGRWFRLPNALGEGQHGYVNDYRGIRHPVALHEPVPSGIDDDELWIDVELNQQVLQLWRGDELVWFTLVSTGAAPMGTPRGVQYITDKMATKTMQSRPDSDDPYMVEDVPWTIHWKPAYAVHGAYWHWGFGRTASHGCINMAPRDVKTVWERIGPEIPDGWHTSWATEDVPGTLLQIRRKGLPTPDKRPDAQVAAN
jgi:hypothetical protein